MNDRLVPLTLLMTFLLAPALPAQEPYLVKDIAPGGLESLPANGFDYNGVLLFRALGNELWRSDGSAAGTSPVKDFSPAVSSLGPAGFALLDGIVYFAATGPDGREPWRTDGTEAGTLPLVDIVPGSQNSNPHSFTALDDVLLFVVASPDGVSIEENSTPGELWRTDGTPGGTVRVFDFNPGGNDFVAGLERLGDRVYFNAADSGADQELWKTDGTVSGTSRVKDINPEDSSSPNGITAFDGEILFAATDSSGDRELWRSDGTEAGTVRVADLWSAGSSTPLDLTPSEGLLFFTATNDDGRELWKSDGTAGGTMQIKDIDPGPSGTLFTELKAMGGVLFFAAEPGSDRELWKSNGTAGGTEQIKDINSTGGSFPGVLTPIDGELYFVADDGDAFGRELWKTDGTEEGTVLVRDLNPGSGDALVNSLVVSGGRLFFQADEENGLGRELYAITVAVPDFVNISTRGDVGTGDDVMIAGFIISGGRKRVLIRAIGPGLDAFGVPGTLNDPMLEVFDGSTEIASNDDWRDTQETEITDSGLAPGFDLESAIMLELDPGPYTAIVSGVGGTTGVALVEVFELE